MSQIKMNARNPDEYYLLTDIKAVLLTLALGAMPAYFKAKFQRSSNMIAEPEVCEGDTLEALVDQVHALAEKCDINPRTFKYEFFRGFTGDTYKKNFHEHELSAEEVRRFLHLLSK